MAISKRLRYEILRRDNHACRYCGRAAPDVKLHIDHVIPVSLGGAEKDPTNLVTSCAECNGGKTSSAPDQTVVDDVKESAAKWKSAMTQAAEEARADASGRTDLYESVVNAWPNFHRNKIPNDFTETVDQFTAAGLPDEVIIEMSRLAGAKPSIYNRWAYFCGCCWTKLRQLQDRAKEIAETAEVESPQWQPLTHDDLGDFYANILDLAAGVLPSEEWRDVCSHGIEWTEDNTADLPCRDLFCVGQRYTFLLQGALDFLTKRKRDFDVMDAADELELVDA